MADLYIIASMATDAKRAGELKALLEPATEAFRKEEGCIAYTLLEDRKVPGRFVTFERWRDEASLAAHMKTPTMAKLGPQLQGLLTGELSQDFLSALKVL